MRKIHKAFAIIIKKELESVNRRVIMKKRLMALSFAMMLAAGSLFTGCGSTSVDKNATLVKVNNGSDNIDAGYGYFRIRFYQATYDGYYLSYFGDGFWGEDMYGAGEPFAETAKTEVMDSIQEAYLAAQHAEEYGVTISDEDMAKIDETVATFMSANSQEALDAMGATEEYVKKMLIDETYRYRVQAAVEAAADITVTDEEAAQATFTYATFSLTEAKDADGNAIEVTDEFKEEQKAKAEELSAADDFDAKAEELAAEVTTHSYTIADSSDDYMDSAVIDAARALKDGEVSSVVETEDACYVLRMDATNDAEATASKKESLEDEKKHEAYDTALESWKGECDWSVVEKQLKKIDLLHDHFTVKEEEVEETTEATEATTETTTETTAQ